jgi:hypothetical protein
MHTIQDQNPLSWQATGALNQSLVEIQAMYALELERQTYQAPFSSGSPQAAQRKLAESQDILDDPDHELDGTFPQTIDRFSDLGLQLVGHLDLSTGTFSRRLRLFCKEGMSIEVLRFATSGDVGIDAPFLAGVDIRFTEVTTIQCRHRMFSYLRIHRIQRGDSFLIVFGMIGQHIG